MHINKKISLTSRKKKPFRNLARSHVVFPERRAHGKNIIIALYIHQYTILLCKYTFGSHLVVTQPAAAGAVLAVKLGISRSDVIVNRRRRLPAIILPSPFG